MSARPRRTGASYAREILGAGTGHVRPGSPGGGLAAGLREGDGPDTPVPPGRKGATTGCGDASRVLRPGPRASWFGRGPALAAAALPCLLSACAVIGPTVPVQPGPGKTADTLAADRQACIVQTDAHVQPAALRPGSTPSSVQALYGTA